MGVLLHDRGIADGPRPSASRCCALGTRGWGGGGFRVPRSRFPIRDYQFLIREEVELAIAVAFKVEAIEIVFATVQNFVVVLVELDIQLLISLIEMVEILIFISVAFAMNTTTAVVA